MKKILSVFLTVFLLLGLLPPASAMTVLSSQNLSVDGKTVDCEKYNIDGSNYFKLRDIAYLLNGTRAQFAVGWDAETQTVSILTKEAYVKNGTELDLTGGDKSATAKPSKQTLRIDGKTVTGLSVYNIGGNNYFKLRDLGNALGFGVGYDDATRTATIDSTALPSVQTPPEDSAYNAEEIYKKCSPAVFYIEVYNAAGNPTASGSGFFIDSSGVAVTNYHVIEGAHSAKILLSDTDAVCEVVGVYDYSKDNDWAVIQVKGSNFPYLKKGDTSTLVGGAAVYAIGSPQGLDNTISEGIISNPNRQLGNVTYIQTSAPISHGSSGGALINKYGEVIGITSAGIEDAENIGFALPISNISGYKSSAVTTLAELTNAPNDENRARALSELRQFILTNANSKYAGYPMYSETKRSADGIARLGMYYDTEYNTVHLIADLIAGNTYRGSGAYIILSLSQTSLEHSGNYFYYNDINSNTWDFLGRFLLNAPEFDGKTLSFKSMDGVAQTAEELAAHRQVAVSLAHSALMFADLFLLKLGSSMRVFGFSL
ncbi:MAG: trypsin-like peptidase domain-containing protein [Oscillospiraceae bacterium]|nr:trypsin-like peptidase domain-containing protein [Oscillospiraceae bacterium]MBR3850088.1 trypsin-like peptidase domain-containing protein [Oscillospiraceae bacterium]